MPEPDEFLPMNRSELIAMVAELTRERDGWQKAHYDEWPRIRDQQATIDTLRREMDELHASHVLRCSCEFPQVDDGDITPTVVCKYHASALDTLRRENANLLRVLRGAHGELTDHGHQELPECECAIADALKTAPALDAATQEKPK